MSDEPQPAPHGALTVDDTWFGPVTITAPDVSPTQARVEGPQLPLTLITRTGTARDHGQAPIGTRDATRLTMTVGDDTARLTLGAGRLRRSSFHIAADLADVTYTFEPADKVTSVLRRDGQELARYIWTADSESAAHWQPVDAVHPRPEDAAVGYLLAAAFGTGAAGTLSLLWDAISEILDATH